MDVVEEGLVLFDEAKASGALKVEDDGQPSMGVPVGCHRGHGEGEERFEAFFRGGELLDRLELLIRDWTIDLTCASGELELSEEGFECSGCAEG